MAPSAKLSTDFRARLLSCRLLALRQFLDRLLQHEPQEGRDLAMTGAG
jgi:hypothetical protein